MNSTSSTKAVASPSTRSGTQRKPSKQPQRVGESHVRKFLEWYAAKVELGSALSRIEPWSNALQTLTVDELREGMRRLSAWPDSRALSPPLLWQLCKTLNHYPTASAFFAAWTRRPDKPIDTRRKPTMETTYEEP